MWSHNQNVISAGALPACIMGHLLGILLRHLCNFGCMWVGTGVNLSSKDVEWETTQKMFKIGKVLFWLIWAIFEPNHTVQLPFDLVFLFHVPLGLCRSSRGLFRFTLPLTLRLRLRLCFWLCFCLCLGLGGLSLVSRPSTFTLFLFHSFRGNNSRSLLRTFQALCGVNRLRRIFNLQRLNRTGRTGCHRRFSHPMIRHLWSSIICCGGIGIFRDRRTLLGQKKSLHLL